MELIDLYMQVARGFGQTMHDVSVAHHLTPMQAMTLARLGDEALPTKEIARHLRCDPSNATGVVDQLEKRGLVRRTTPARDRRIRAVELTPDGAGVQAELRRAMDDVTTVFDRLDAEDRTDLHRILTILSAES